MALLENASPAKGSKTPLHLDASGPIHVTLVDVLKPFTTSVVYLVDLEPADAALYSGEQRAVQSI